MKLLYYNQTVNLGPACASNKTVYIHFYSVGKEKEEKSCPAKIGPSSIGCVGFCFLKILQSVVTLVSKKPFRKSLARQNIYYEHCMYHVSRQSKVQ